KELESFPDRIATSVYSLERDPNPALAGYLFAHLARRVTVTDAELEAALLVRMIGVPAVPVEFWEHVAAEMVLNYYRLSLHGRTLVVRRFAELGQDADLRAALPVLRGLIRIAALDDTIRTMIETSALAKVTAVYRILARTGRLVRDEKVEA